MGDTLPSKIRIKMGAIEVEYEGSESFLKEELPDLLAAVSKLYQESGGPAATGDLTGGGAGGSGTLQGTTGTLAAKLKVKSGPDLILAACARLTFVLGKQSFTRKDITTEMQAATAYYKKTYLNNLTKYLQGLVKDGKLVEPTDGQYALQAATRTELEKSLA